MQHISIKSHKTNDIIYEGSYANMRSCVEAAIIKNIDLSYADLQYEDLRNANLDGGRFVGSLFNHCNLTGANLSESNLRSCQFSNSTLYNCCLAYSDLAGSVFENSDFGATDVTHSILQGCSFSGLSSFTLSFHSAQSIEGSVFKTVDGIKVNMNVAPIVIHGLDAAPLIIFQHDMLLGHRHKKIKVNFN